MSKQGPSPSDRRSFITSLKTGLASFAAITGVAMAQKKTPGSESWQPARHEKDDWLDKPSSKHRVVFDSTSAETFGEAVFFANNFVRVNRSAYGLENSDVAVLVIARHRSTPFGYNDAMWAKYGVAIAERALVQEPKTKLAPKVNLFNATGYGETLHNRGVTLDALAKQGVQLGVCSVSTRGYAGVIADVTGGNADAIFNELTSNLVSNALMVPAGIVAVNRAQERGYTLVAG